MRLSASQTIERPTEDVFAFWADASNNPRWQGGMRSCRWTSAPPIGVGSTYEQVARFLGTDVVTTFEVTDFQPGRSITISSVESSFPITVTRRIEPLGEDRCRVEAVIHGQPGRFFALAGPLLRRLAQRNVDRDYDRLKELLESSS